MRAAPTAMRKGATRGATTPWASLLGGVVCDGEAALEVVRVEVEVVELVDDAVLLDSVLVVELEDSVDDDELVVEELVDEAVVEELLVALLEAVRDADLVLLAAEEEAAAPPSTPHCSL
jgi:hypothetical protein